MTKKEELLKLLQLLGIDSEANLKEELKNACLDIGFFVSPRKEV